MPIRRIIIYIAISFTLSGCSEMQFNYINKARLFNFAEQSKNPLLEKRQKSVNLLLSGHYVEADDNLVLLIRSFDRGSFFSIDDEGYEKLSIEIKSYRIGEPIYLNSPDISFYYSRGSSAFINKGHGVYSASGSGEIIIKRKEKNRLIVKIDLSLNAEPAGAYPFEAEKVEIKGEYIFIEKKVSELTPWLGMPDPSLGKEVYP